MASLRQAARRSDDSGEQAASLRWAMQGAVMVVVLALVAWAGWTLWSPQSFPLRTVRITTPLEHVPQEAIRNAVAQYATAGFVRVDMKGMREQLEAIPWVYRISLRRVWPDVIEVGVAEQVPVARWEKGGLVNEHGDVFMPGSESELLSLPLFAGPDGSGKTIVDHHKELSGMAAAIDIHLNRIELSERRAWSVEIDNGLLLSLGRSDTYPRMQRFIKTYSQSIAPRLTEIERIDLRYTNGFAIRWRDGSKPSA